MDWFWPIHCLICLLCLPAVEWGRSEGTYIKSDTRFSSLIQFGLRSRRICAFLVFVNFLVFFFFFLFDEKDQRSENIKRAQSVFRSPSSLKLIFTLKMNVFAKPSCCLFGEHLTYMGEPLTSFHFHLGIFPPRPVVCVMCCWARL